MITVLKIDWRRILASCLTVGLVSCLALSARAQAPAFPEAEGAGATATGGHDGTIYFVTNLNDHGPGSLREGISQSNRIILFRVSGTIALESRLDIAGSNITIAGQSAPGGGICLKNHSLVISGENIIVRFLRIRPGDEAKQETDALTIWGANRVMVDHCSLSWSTDSVNDVVRDSTNVTVQWCVISEPLNDSVHSKGAHGYGTGWGSGAQAGNSFHHNLLAHCNSRSPRLGSEKGALLDVRNNVIYNMGSGWAYGGEHARINYVANYYRPGPSTRHPDKIFRVSSPETRMFLADNFVEGDKSVTQENQRGLVADDGISLDETRIAVNEPFPTPNVTTHTAKEAYSLVLAHAGASLPVRDAVDVRIVADVRKRTGRIINSQTDVGGWPELAAVLPPADTDNDGLPDEWETRHGLDPQQPDDAKKLSADGHSQLEHYLNELASSAINDMSQ